MGHVTIKSSGSLFRQYICFSKKDVSQNVIWKQFLEDLLTSCQVFPFCRHSPIRLVHTLQLYTGLSTSVPPPVLQLSTKILLLQEASFRLHHLINTWEQVKPSSHYSDLKEFVGETSRRRTTGGPGFVAETQTASQNCVWRDGLSK